MRRNALALFAAAAAILALGVVMAFVTRESRDPGRLSTRQEIALGGRAAGAIAARHGGLDPDPEQRKRVGMIGERIVRNSAAAKSPYPFAFHVLDDAATPMVFALPDGEVLVTDALLARLTSDDEVAGILSHALAHTLTRDPSRQIEAARLAPKEDTDEAANGAVARLAALRFSVDEEAAADRLTVRLMSDAGYDPEAFAVALQKLESAGAQAAPFFAMHPNPGHRVSRVRAATAELRLAH